ncbi:MAG: hypothetical protein R2912_11400 [Eubacteriales bacterium]
MGLKFMLIRLGLSLIGIPIIAVVTNRLLSSAQKDEIYVLNGAEPPN